MFLKSLPYRSLDGNNGMKKYKLIAMFRVDYGQRQFKFLREVSNEIIIGKKVGEKKLMFYKTKTVENYKVLQHLFKHIV